MNGIVHKYSHFERTPVLGLDGVYNHNLSFRPCHLDLGRPTLPLLVPDEISTDQSK
jgi:hypothetical protein